MAEMGDSTSLPRLGAGPQAAGQAITIPSYLICGGAPLIHPILAAAGLAPAAWFLHSALWVLAPLNVILLAAGYYRHRRPKAMGLGAAGSISILVHLTTHDTFGLTFEGVPGMWGNLLLIRGGALLLVLGAVLEWKYQRRFRDLALAKQSVEAYWRAVLEGNHPGLRRGRRVYGVLPHSPRCKLCNAPFAGPGSWMMRAIGKRPAEMNPNFCGDCLSKTPVGGAEVILAMLFADVRGSTSMAEKISATEFGDRMNRFYAEAARVLIRHDALIDKFVGDQVVALFVPGYAGPAYAKKAAAAAKDLIEATGHGHPSGPWMPVGVGLHVGKAFVGVMGAENQVTDVTALGDAVNTAARLVSEAGVGEILVSSAAAEEARLETAGLEGKQMSLKGRRAPLTVYTIRRHRAG